MPARFLRSSRMLQFMALSRGGTDGMGKENCLVLGVAEVLAVGHFHVESHEVDLHDAFVEVEVDAGFVGKNRHGAPAAGRVSEEGADQFFPLDVADGNLQRRIPVNINFLAVKDVEEDGLAHLGHAALDVREGPGDHLVGEQERNDAQNGRHDERGPQERQALMPAALAAVISWSAATRP